MAIIDYLGVQTALKTILDADSRTDDYTIEVEPEYDLITDKMPYVAIYLDTWETPSTDEIIGGTNPFRTFLNLELWMYDFSLENYVGATKRDTMIGNVKEVLKENRTISDNVLVTTFTGGSFDNQKNDRGLGFFKGVSLRIQCEVRE